MTGGERTVRRGGGVSMEGRPSAVFRSHLLLERPRAMKVEPLLSRHHP